MSKIFARFGALDSDSEASAPSSPLPATLLPMPSAPAVVADWRGESVGDAELRQRFQSLCRANGLDRLFAEERYLDLAWSGTAVQVWRSDTLGERCPPEEDRLVMAKPIGRVGVWGAIFENDIEEMTEKAHAEWAALDHAAVAAAEAAAAAERFQRRIAEKVSDESRRNLKRGEQVQKKPCPCARLYKCVGDKSTGGAKPTVTRAVPGDCWGHRDFLLGKVPADCSWLHPGEAGWKAEWNNFPSLGALMTAIRPPRAAAVAPPQPSGRFAALSAPTRSTPLPPPAAPWAPKAKPSAAPAYKYGRYRPGGKFEDSGDEAEARSEWIESQKDRSRNRDY